jgi:hypothetical protein
MLKLLATIVGVWLSILAANAVSFFAASSPPSVPQYVEGQDGAIAGRVVDADGRPIIGAIVLAERPDIIIRPTPRAWTNKDGQFEIVNLGAGLYVLHTAKESDGYPPSEFNLYDEGENNDFQVQVAAHQTTQNVIIQRGLKAAVLEGRIVDAKTRQPLKDAQITVRRIDQPERFLSTGLFWHGVEGGFKFLVPPLPFTVNVSAPGYQDWHYKLPGRTQTTGALFLAPNTTKDLLVALQPPAE